MTSPLSRGAGPFSLARPAGNTIRWPCSRQHCGPLSRRLCRFQRQPTTSDPAADPATTTVRAHSAVPLELTDSRDQVLMYVEKARSFVQHGKSHYWVVAALRALGKQASTVQDYIMTSPDDEAIDYLNILLEQEADASNTVAFAVLSYDVTLYVPGGADTYTPRRFQDMTRRELALLLDASGYSSLTVVDSKPGHLLYLSECPNAVTCDEVVLYDDVQIAVVLGKSAPGR